MERGRERDRGRDKERERERERGETDGQGEIQREERQMDRGRERNIYGSTIQYLERMYFQSSNRKEICSVCLQESEQ